MASKGPAGSGAAASAGGAALPPGAEGMFVRDYLLSARNPRELRGRLEALYEVLRGMEQLEPEDIPPGMDNVAAELITEPVLQSKTPVCSEVAWGCCCCPTRAGLKDRGAALRMCSCGNRPLGSGARR